MRIIECLLETTAKSVSDLRRRVSGVRYGPPGQILFNLDGITYTAPEPTDVMPVGCGDASIRWALRQYLDGKANPYTIHPTIAQSGPDPDADINLDSHSDHGDN